MCWVDGERGERGKVKNVERKGRNRIRTEEDWKSLAFVSTKSLGI